MAVNVVWEAEMVALGVEVAGMEGTAAWWVAVDWSAEDSLVVG